MVTVLNKNWKNPFTSTWKLGRPVLIEKHMKETDTKSTYRPICLLKEMGKIYDRIINKKLKEEIDRNGGLADFQYGFRKGKSTMDALYRVREIATLANTGALLWRDFFLW